MSSDDLYVGREQTFVKHFILEKYLERFAFIVGTSWQSLTYVDCFSGPWNARSEELKDSSFSIALSQLRKAQRVHAQRGRRVELRCFFLEKDGAAFQRLRDYADGIRDVTIRTRNASLEESVDEIVSFVREGGPTSFPFILIDPTGWSGFALDTIAPLLRLEPCEVLINFMTGHISRFLRSPDQETQGSFERLFGSGDFRERIRGMEEPQDREDAAVDEYVRSIKRVGGYPFACSAIVLNPQKSRTHFHLVYATRNAKGIEVFKETERKAMAVQEKARAEAGRRKRLERTGQFDFISELAMQDPHYSALRDRYLAKMQRDVAHALRQAGRLPYDDAWQLVLSSPLTWERDLKAWIAQNKIEVQRLAPGQRVPQRGKGNLLIRPHNF